jgi:hypothetical protein
MEYKLKTLKQEAESSSSEEVKAPGTFKLESSFYKRNERKENRNDQ